MVGLRDSSAATRISSPAVNSSASRSPEPLAIRPALVLLDEPVRRRSTSACEPACAPTWPGCCATLAPPRCSSPTTKTRPCRSPTGSRSCGAGGSPSAPLPASSTSGPPMPSWPPSSARPTWSTASWPPTRCRPRWVNWRWRSGLPRAAPAVAGRPGPTRAGRDRLRRAPRPRGRVTGCEYHGHDAIVTVEATEPAGRSPILVRVAGGGHWRTRKRVTLVAHGPVVAWTRREADGPVAPERAARWSSRPPSPSVGRESPSLRRWLAPWGGAAAPPPATWRVVVTEGSARRRGRPERRQQVLGDATANGFVVGAGAGLGQLGDPVDAAAGEHPRAARRRVVGHVGEAGTVVTDQRGVGEDLDVVRAGLLGVVAVVLGADPTAIRVPAWMRCQQRSTPTGRRRPSRR